MADNNGAEPGPEVAYDEFMEEGGAGDEPGLEDSGMHARAEQEPSVITTAARS